MNNTSPIVLANKSIKSVKGAGGPVCWTRRQAITAPPPDSGVARAPPSPLFGRGPMPLLKKNSEDISVRDRACPDISIPPRYEHSPSGRGLRKPILKEVRKVVGTRELGYPRRFSWRFSATFSMTSISSSLFTVW